MATIAEIKIPHMFTAYAEDQGERERTGLLHYQYFCRECVQLFSSAWGADPHSMHLRGNRFHCTWCGRKHQRYVVYIDRNEPAPDKVRMVIKEFKNVVAFELYCEAFKFTDYLRGYTGRYKEMFRFDLAAQTVTFRKGWSVLSEPVDIGNPFELDVFRQSILRFFTPSSLAAERKSELLAFLKILRDTVRRKLEKHLGYKVSSMFVSPGQYHGIFLLPIFNMAYRVTCPDAPNLPEAYRYDTRGVWDFWASKMIEGRKGEPGQLVHSLCAQNVDYMDAVIDQTRKKKDFVSALIEALSLPDKPMVRRALMEDPFDAIKMTMAFSVCRNYDHAMQLLAGLVNLMRPGWSRYPEGLLPFLKIMKHFYGEAGIARFVTEARELQLIDCVGLHRQLNRANKKAMRTERPRLRELHDWLSLRHKKQEHKNVKFFVPAHIVNRLSMQRGRLSFFLPAESMELLEAGHLLHNCVAAYSEDIKNNELWIVLLANDRGRLVACLEVNGEQLTQAKADRNKPVSDDAGLNEVVLAWAQAAALEIITDDVRVPKTKKGKEKIPA